MTRVLFALFALVVTACGGTTGQPPSLDTTAGDATTGDAAGPALVDAGEPRDGTLESSDFDVVIGYADREIPDASTPPDTGAGVIDAGPVTCPDQVCKRQPGGKCTPVECLALKGCPAGSCTGNDGGACTPTECLLFQHSKDCYDCMLAQGCIDDDTFGDTGFECGDFDPLARNQEGTPRTELCLDAVQCVLSSSCAANGVADCYCGDLKGNACAGPSGQNGACKAIEELALESTDPPTILNNYSTNSSKGGSVANALFQCAAANIAANDKCKSCITKGP